jgi:hypothetical protein
MRQISTSRSDGSGLMRRWLASIEWTTRTEAERSFSSSVSSSKAT